jgi:hypothetical protein
MGSTAQVRIKLLAPYCQSRSHETPKLNKELSDDYEKRTWRERLHVNEQDEVIIPGIALQNCIKEAAKFLSISIPGKGKSTFTKHFESGVSVIGDIETGVRKAMIAAMIASMSLLQDPNGEPKYDRNNNQRPEFDPIHTTYSEKTIRRTTEISVEMQAATNG